MMNLRTLVQAAAVLSWYGSIESDLLHATHTDPITEYWKATRFLIRSWEERIRKLRNEQRSAVPLAQLAEEVVASELFTRTVAAILLSSAERTGNDQVARIAEYSVDEHQQVRKTVLCVLEYAGNDVSATLRCERLARKLERWSDLLAAPYSFSESALLVAFDQERCLDFGDEWSEAAEEGHDPVALQLQLSALSFAVPNSRCFDTMTESAHLSRCESGFSLVAQSMMHPANRFTKQQFVNMLYHGSLDSIAPSAGSSSPHI